MGTDPKYPHKYFLISIGGSIKDFEEELLEIVCDEGPNALYDLADLYRRCSDGERQAIRSQWDFGREWSWPTAYSLACNIPGEPEPKVKVLTRLTMESITDFGGPDIRENLMSLGETYLSAPHAGLDPDSIFEEVAVISSDRVASQLREFCARNPEDKSLEAWCLRAIRTWRGVKFVMKLPCFPAATP